MAAPCLNAFWPPRPAATSSCAGYENFAAHGGDLGATVSPEIARVAPDRVIGVHVSGALSFPGQIVDTARNAMSQLDQDRLKRVGTFMNDECGYIAIQSTRPGLVGIAVTADRLVPWKLTWSP